MDLLVVEKPNGATASKPGEQPRKPDLAVIGSLEDRDGHGASRREGSAANARAIAATITVNPHATAR